MHACPDAELLAAWSDEGLTGVERDEVERHVADCARCQAQLAAMVRIEPAWEEAKGRRQKEQGKRPWLWPWLVPVSAAATAVAVWVLVQPAGAPVVRDEIAQLQERSAAAPPAPAPSAVEGPAPSAPEAQPPQADERLRDQAAKLKALPERRDSSAVGSNVRPQASRDELKRENDARFAERALAKDAAKAAAPAAATPAAAAEAENRARAAATAPAPSSAPARVEGPAPSGARARVEGPAPSVTSRRVEEPAERAQVPTREAPAPMEFRQQLPPFDVVSSDPRVRWRIAGTTVQRSADGGASWETQVPWGPASAGSGIGVSTALTAGASPSPQVCWLVGRRGTVLLTTDGRTWRRVPFPEQSDLTAVRATSAQTAVVTTADGRRFATSDAGLTWAPAPPPPPR